MDFSSINLGSTHEEYFKKYQENFDKYIKIQNNIASDDDYGKLKILDAVNTDKDRGYFKFAAPNFKVHWLEGTEKINLLVTKTTQNALLALLLQVDNLEETDKFGGIMTFLFPAIRAIRSQDEKSETLQSLSATKALSKLNHCRRKL